MSAIFLVDIKPSAARIPESDQQRATDALEAGKVVFLPEFGFALEDSERRFLTPASSDGRTKNISFNPRTGRVGGTSLQGKDLEDLERLFRRFVNWSRSLVETMLPRYAAHLETARTSFRPVSIDNRPTSYRKDDRRLHVDAFRSEPIQGRRILRVFANVNPEGQPREWRVGEPFADFAAKFVSRAKPALPGSSWLLHRVGLTRGPRRKYDHLMLQLHDRAKEDMGYQSSAPQELFKFPAGSTWIVFTDQVLHAAISGQHALEQTFYLDVADLKNPSTSPLRVLEQLTHSALV